MDLRRWVARRDPDWQTLDQILTRTEKKGIKSLSAEEIQSLAGLYRAVSADLARAQTHNLNPRLRQNLQSLITRAYGQIYQGDRRQEWNKVLEFYRWQLPLVMQQTWGYTLTAFGIFLVAGLIAWWYGWQDPTFMALVVPEELIVIVRDEGKLWMGSILTMKPLAASGIMVNNLSVAFGMVAGGGVLGLWTIYALFYNGLLIGAVGALVSQHNLALPFWGFVFPHGALELPAIFLAGAAGLLIAKAIVWPAPYRRGQALKLQAIAAAQLVFGIIPLLIIAGVIEGFISPAPWIPDGLKYLLGSGFFLLLLSYGSRQKPSV